jgi:DNA processing protein
MSVVDCVALSLVPFERRRTLGEPLRHGRTPADLLRDLADRSEDPRDSIHGLRDAASACLASAPGRGLSAVAWEDARYPPALSAIGDPPPVLWVRGFPDVLHQPTVAIVGSRAGSPYALAVARRLGADLARHGVVIASGLARGVDSAAHRGALDAGGVTVAVLGCGADIVYPAEHRDLAAEIARTGAVVSELVPGTRPRPYLFPLRNRIISGLSRAVVVVEAGEKSGSLITARCALDQGRDVMAVPGNVLDGRNRGGHALIRDGAKLVESAADILEELALPSSDHPAEPRVPGNGRHDPVWASLPPGEACDLDTLAHRSGWPGPRLLARLCELELQGLVARAGGGRFIRVDRSC